MTTMKNKKKSSAGAIVLVVTVVVLLALLTIHAFSRGSTDEIPQSDINADELYALAVEHVEQGPRYSGSEGAQKTAEWIVEKLKKYPSFKVETQTFEDDTPEGKKTFRNIIADYGPSEGSLVIIGCHYDTKKLNSAPDFQGANDGASGVAALLGIASELESGKFGKDKRIRLVFFDGEEALYNYSANDGLHGSRYAANEWEKDGTLKNTAAFILLDMIGDKDLKIMVPAETSPEMRARLLSVVKRNGTEKFFDFNSKNNMHDDHIPFLEKGIPSIDLIDFSYGEDNSYWHTSSDSIDKITGPSMKTAADTALDLALTCFPEN